MSLLFTILQVCLFASAASHFPKIPRHVDYADVNGTSFDYVIVGGGLTGLVVANRLSELKDGTPRISSPTIS
jgi:hypothetical protein